MDQHPYYVAVLLAAIPVGAYYTLRSYRVALAILDARDARRARKAANDSFDAELQRLYTQHAADAGPLQ